MSDAARMEILNQLSKGKLSANEAAELLHAINDKAKPTGEPVHKEKDRARKLHIQLNGRAVKNGPHVFTLPLGFINTIRSMTDMVPAVRNVIMWDAMNLVGGELADITISVE